MNKVSSHLSAFFYLYAELTINYLMRWSFKISLSQLMWGPHFVRERNHAENIWVLQSWGLVEGLEFV